MSTDQGTGEQDGTEPAPDETRDTAFPVAEVKPAGPGLWETVRASKLWLGTLACVVAAIVLIWLAVGSGGPGIVVQFDEGHGIKAGDVVRYRGIEVGLVTEVLLTSGLGGIEAHVTLNSAAAGLAREGSRFWIVRPQFSLSGVSGLETAVGAKYIAVDPGDDSGPKQKVFEGLTEVPVDGLEHAGLTLKLTAEERHGISQGSPVTYRGVDVGQLLTIELSDDAGAVDVGVRIDPKYQHLVSATSKFWISSGIGVDLGLSGIRLNADSLTSVARGGISFINPPMSEGDEAAPAATQNQWFVLHEEAAKEWFKTPAKPLRDRIPFLGGKSKPKPKDK